MNQLNLDESLYRQQQVQNNFIPNWSRASRPERDAVSLARDNYVGMAQADLGLAATEPKFAAGARIQPAPHPEWRDWRERDIYYEDLASTRLAELQPANGTGGPRGLGPSTAGPTTARPDCTQLKSTPQT
ncbi:hypothetical protein EDD41_0481 [Luteococcus japonicus]|uniref:Uncharacterized protein n=1 Tax=Luteococcus japonicus TaxID=33984 RepID=A0A3N1ZR18_9ACTN|nr:hypothetical protein [Luteococcus japonicus]ROR53340.1 hypothetical protein EDD41_0481 [Luteococcus japonicus]